MQAAFVGAILYSPEWLRPHWEAIMAFFGSPMMANVAGILLLHVSMLLACNLFFLVLYRTEMPFFEQYKISQAPWPWKAGGQKAATFWELARQSVPVTAVNLALTVPLALANYGTAVRLGFSADAKDYPGVPRVAAHLLVFMLVEDVMFYWGHRTLHHPALYKHVHKLHHRYYHSVSIAAEFAHPVEFVIVNVLPFATGPLLMGSHLVTQYVWVVWRIGETVFNHSGYDLPFSPWELLPFQGTAAAHDAHHSANTGNFGSFFRFWDWACGTAIPDAPEQAATQSEAEAKKAK